MKPFRFRQFEVYDHLSTMRVGTDGVILGAYSSRRNFKNAIDIGTGCGLIALMLAQKSTGNVVAIDVDDASVVQANENFKSSPWFDRLKVNLMSVQELMESENAVFDRMVSNPPYFVDSLLSPDKRKTKARHSGITISHDELVHAAVKLLVPDGVFDIILPFETSLSFESRMFLEGFYLIEELIISSFEGHKPVRRIMSFSRKLPQTVVSEKIAVRANNEHFSDEYRNYTADFFIGLV
ncbi:MAG: methyltransferase [Bacteroidetes bacterium HGW-Bacteroidetes-6]|jgi:tRNA1Val (adenine37-N6)-methyltransferase|nr:MAG: methyltransferase [Bacteroidetes bacterium HGW-Bacteroidetes-6]